jgi:hypothetical protein
VSGGITPTSLKPDTECPAPHDKVGVTASYLYQSHYCITTRSRAESIRELLKAVGVLGVSPGRAWRRKLQMRPYYTNRGIDGEISAISLAF